MAFHAARLPTFCAVLLACLGGKTPAQSPTGSGSEPSPATQPAGSVLAPRTYALQVKVDRADLRILPDRNSLVAIRVGRDRVLRATEESFGWHRVLPLPGFFCYVSARYIDQIAPERGIVSVSSGRLRVRAGSLERTVDPGHSEVLALLKRGTEVRLLGRDGDWFRIVPPKGIYLYIHDDLVERISEDLAQRLERLATQPVRPQAPASAGSPDVEPPDLSGPWGRRLVEVERRIAAEAERPPLEQAWEPLIEALEPIAAQRAEPLTARLASAWIEQLRQRQAAQEALKIAERVEREARRRQDRLQRELEQLRRASSQPARGTP